ncbi:hypothetical protein [Mesorhizobium comanense]|uniref:hypothetical protein n=1 Tax=Mesorhizobium comanense TaxID=2502215 RepID=UPI0010F81AED|nr:hypothetical protein [Mesorhizobium comanense]
MEVTTLGEDGWNQTVFLEQAGWTRLLVNLEAANDTVFGITRGNNSYFQGSIVPDLLEGVPGNFFGIDAGYIAAILVHEGSMRLHHGQLPRASFDAHHGHPFEARVYLRKSD